MLLDAAINPPTLQAAGPTAAAAEALGLAGLWTSEVQHDPFLPLALAAVQTERSTLGTSIAVAFPRSPTVTAYTAWDLARASQGRFILGLGTQVKAHIERRFSVPWDAPVPRLRDYIAAMRALWQTWQTGERLRHEGPYYTLKLMTPFFDPGPLDVPPPPVWIAGVNEGLARMAGEVCDGFLAHPFHSVRYLREALRPWIASGLTAAGRPPDALQMSVSTFVIFGEGAARDRMRAEVQQQLAFYASTPNYATVLALHGWEEIGTQLTGMAARGRWAEMGALISDEMLAEFAVEGATFAAAVGQLPARYAGLADRVTPYLPFVPGRQDAAWAEAVAAFGA
ncbi:MAG: TIGR03617 family F420-dependent LLM class oxidoreductase [Chloroflexota bacterium]|nr:TIGR03617 family F420-dependent LLM class oxidoreductase [Chloroflexota bacterium]